MLDIGPQLDPSLPFPLGQLGQGSAKPREVGGPLPALERLLEQGTTFGLTAFQPLAPRQQLGAQPVQGLPAEAGALRGTQCPGVLALIQPEL